MVKKIGQYLKMNITVPDEYIEGFVKANNTFLYQLVFDPINRKVVPLNPYPEHIDPATLSYAGVYPLYQKSFHYIVSFVLSSSDTFLLHNLSYFQYV